MRTSACATSPFGGISETTAAPYLAEPSIAALGGSWIAPRNLIQNHDFAEITARARRAREIVLKIRAAQ